MDGAEAAPTSASPQPGQDAAPIGVGEGSSLQDLAMLPPPPPPPLSPRQSPRPSPRPSSRRSPAHSQVSKSRSPSRVRRDGAAKRPQRSSPDTPEKIFSAERALYIKDLEALSKQSDMLREENAALRKKLHGVQRDLLRERGALVRQVRSLKKVLEDQRRRLRETEDAMTLSQEEVEKRGGAIGDLRKSLRALERRHEERLASERRDFELRLGAQADDLRSKKQALQAVRGQLHDYRSQHSRTLETYRLAVDEAVLRSTAAERDRDHLRGELAAATERAEQLEAERLRDAGARPAGSPAPKRDAALARLRRRAEAAEGRAEALERERRAALDATAKARAELEAASDLARRNAALAARVDALERERDALLGEREAAGARREAVDAAVGRAVEAERRASASEEDLAAAEAALRGAQHLLSEGAEAAAAGAPAPPRGRGVEDAMVRQVLQRHSLHHELRRAAGGGAGARRSPPSPECSLAPASPSLDRTLLAGAGGGSPVAALRRRVARLEEERDALVREAREGEGAAALRERDALRRALRTREEEVQRLGAAQEDLRRTIDAVTRDAAAAMDAAAAPAARRRVAAHAAMESERRRMGRENARLRARLVAHEARHRVGGAGAAGAEAEALRGRLEEARGAAEEALRAVDGATARVRQVEEEKGALARELEALRARPAADEMPSDSMLANAERRLLLREFRALQDAQREEERRGREALRQAQLDMRAIVEALERDKGRLVRRVQDQAIVIHQLTLSMGAGPPSPPGGLLGASAAAADASSFLSQSLPAAGFDPFHVALSEERRHPAAAGGGDLREEIPAERSFLDAEDGALLRESVARLRQLELA